MTRRKWSELTERQRQAILAAGVVQLTLQAAALADLHRRPAKRVRGSKNTWRALSFVNFLGPLAYFARGRT